MDHALFYAGLGWSVVPSHRVVTVGGKKSCTCSQGIECSSKGKHPAVNWTIYQTQRATREQIIQWFSGQYRDYGVGIITGAVSGIFVIDIDEAPGKDGSDTLQNMQMVFGDLPHTVQARTGGGGRHLVYRHPGGIWINTAKNVFGPGVDVRGDGGFIVAAPSLHESGKFYLWDETAHPHNTQIATSPAWVIDQAETSTPSQTGGTKQTPTGSGEIIRDTWGKVVDGRERHMVGIVCGVIASLSKGTSVLPEPETVFAEAWPSYERTTKARSASLEEDGRGESLMQHRIKHMLRRAGSGKWKISPGQDGGSSRVDYDPETGEVFGERAQQKTEPPKRPLILSLAELDALPPPVWLIEKLIPENSLIVPYGPPKAGKTFIILSAGLHIAAARPWFGMPVQGGAVVYIAGEGVGGLGMRLRAMRAHHDISADIPFWVVRRAINFRVEAEVKALLNLIKETIKGIPLRLLVIDTLARAMPGADENSAQDVGLVIAACEYLKEELSCTVAPVHHSGKDEERGARGTSALRGAWDAAFKITGQGKSITLTVVDQKDAEGGQVLRFKMEEIPVGIGRTSLVPVLVTDGPNTGHDQTGALSGLTGLAYTILMDLLAGPEAGQMPATSGLPLNVRGVSMEVFRRSFYERMSSRTAEARQKAFVRAVDALQNRRLVGIKDPWIWAAKL